MKLLIHLNKECLVVKLVRLIVQSVWKIMAEDNDVQISRLGSRIRMVPFTGKEKSGVRMELRRREVKSSIWGLYRLKCLKDFQMEMSSSI